VSMNRVGLALVLAFGFTGCSGDDGASGVPGLACWDINENATCDLDSEDLDKDGKCSVSDCRAIPGPTPDSGPTPDTGLLPDMAPTPDVHTPTAPGYVGSATCAQCHQDHADKHAKSGHPSKITKVVNATAPTRPFDSVTGGVPDPPLGLTWADVTYVIGGFGWKARYLDKDGYLLTGTETDKTQWNFANTELGKAGAWVAYHATRPVGSPVTRTTAAARSKTALKASTAPLLRAAWVVRPAMVLALSTPQTHTSWRSRSTARPRPVANVTVVGALKRSTPAVG